MHHLLPVVLGFCTCWIMSERMHITLIDSLIKDWKMHVAKLQQQKLPSKDVLQFSCCAYK